MIANGTNFWDFNALLGDQGDELVISSTDIHVYPLFKDDYQFTSDEIRTEHDSLRKIGINTRLIVERTADGYSLIGPLLPYIALTQNGVVDLPCIVRSGDLPQIQQVLSIKLNAEYTRLSPLVYSRLILRLDRLFPIMKSVSHMNLGIKRNWIAGILNISSSAVLRYSYISKVPEALQLRCNNPGFPYLCYKDASEFTDLQFQQLLDELIHYELHSRYIQISARELSDIIRRIASVSERTDASPTLEIREFSGVRTSNTPNLYDPLTEAYYHNLIANYTDRFDDEIDAGTASEMIHIASKGGYCVPDDALRDASYLLFSLTRMKLTSGQRLLDYACLRCIQDSVLELYNMIP